MSNIYLVTGASSGIGNAICFALLEQGHKVIGVARSKKQAVNKLINKFNDNFVFEEKDLATDIDNLPKWVSNLAIKYGKLSGLVHAAGMVQVIPNRFNSYQKMLEVFNLNLFSGLSLAKAFSDKRVCKNDNVSLVFISSVAAHIGTSGLVNYSASKSALIGTVKSLAKELAPKRIRVNSISPGLIKTDLTQNTCEVEFFEKLEKLYPLGLGKPEYIANTAVFLLSEQAQWITGTDIIVDGGITLGINE